ncbi:MAG: hypothetical protein ACI8PT_004028, partial [Gammaproteobacteria bacterium]
HFREMNSDIEVRVESVRSAIEAGESAETVLTQLDQVELVLKTMRRPKIGL